MHTDKPFDPSKPFRQADGIKPRILTVEGRGDRPIVGYIGNLLRTWHADGRFFKEDGLRSEFNLVNYEWRLPDPPPGREWHRTDFNEEDLPEGWRPLLAGEIVPAKSEVKSPSGEWVVTLAEEPRKRDHWKTRTKRPLPTPQEVDLGPEDVPPGSAIRTAGNPTWRLITATGDDFVFFEGESPMTYRELREYKLEILRPGQSDWKPCSKTI